MNRSASSRRSRQELAARVASFARWHYEFELAGVRTPLQDPAHANRHRQRERYFFAPLLDRLGGSLAGRRVLDLGCNAGYWGLRSLQAGADFVLGIDARPMHIEQAQLVFETNEIDDSRYELQCGDFLGLELGMRQPFDVVLCLGVLYHVGQPYELMRTIASSRAATLVIDTSLSMLSAPVFEVRHDDPGDPRHAAFDEFVLWPSEQAVIDLAASFGYRTDVLEPQMSDWSGCEDYGRHERRAFLCVREGVA